MQERRQASYDQTKNTKLQESKQCEIKSNKDNDDEGKGNHNGVNDDLKENKAREEQWKGANNNNNVKRRYRYEKRD